MARPLHYQYAGVAYPTTCRNSELEPPAKGKPSQNAHPINNVSVRLPFRGLSEAGHIHILSDRAIHDEVSINV